MKKLENLTQGFSWVISYSNCNSKSKKYKNTVFFMDILNEERWFKLFCCKLKIIIVGNTWN